MLKLLLVIILLVAAVILFYEYYFCNKKYEEKRSLFVQYLLSTHDMEALKAIGEINPFGAFERWNPASYKLKKFFEARIEKNNDEKFILFFEDFNEFVKMYKLTLMPAFLFVFIAVSVMLVQF